MNKKSQISNLKSQIFDMVSFGYRSLSRNHRKISTGFTLIELLIVISIIGILTTIASVNFIGVRERARDAQRKSDLAQIQTALELFRADLLRYPTRLELMGTACNQSFTNGGETVYLKKVPCDPQTKEQYHYERIGAGNLDYILYACLENENDKAIVAKPADANTDCAESTYYVVENP